MYDNIQKVILEEEKEIKKVDETLFQYGGGFDNFLNKEEDKKYTYPKKCYTYGKQKYIEEKINMGLIENNNKINNKIKLYEKIDEFKKENNINANDIEEINSTRFNQTSIDGQIKRKINEKDIPAIIAKNKVIKMFEKIKNNKDKEIDSVLFKELFNINIDDIKSNIFDNGLKILKNTPNGLIYIINKQKLEEDLDKNKVEINNMKISMYRNSCTKIRNELSKYNCNLRVTRRIYDK
jgi:hypothetical protein